MVSNEQRATFIKVNFKCNLLLKNNYKLIKNE